MVCAGLPGGSFGLFLVAAFQRFQAAYPAVPNIDRPNFEAFALLHF